MSLTVYSNCVIHICGYIIVTLYSLRLLHLYQNRVSILHSELIPKMVSLWPFHFTVRLWLYNQLQAHSLIELQVVITLTNYVYMTSYTTKPNHTKRKAKPFSRFCLKVLQHLLWLGLCQLCQHNKKHNRRAYYISIMDYNYIATL